MIKIVALLSMPVVVGLAVNLANSGLSGSEVVPVMQSGKLVYAIRCNYSTFAAEKSVEIGPASADSTKLDRTACPAKFEAAQGIQFIQTDM